MNISHKLRKPARIVGGLLFAASLYFIYDAASALQPGARLARLGAGGLCVVLLSSIAYAALLTLLAIGWHEVASGANPHQPKLPSIIAYARSVLAKYLPGSIFQYASRQMFGASAGFDQKHMALSSMVEVALHIIVATMLASAMLALSGLWGFPALAAGIGAAFALAMLAARKLPGFGQALVLQLAFFAGFALIAALIAWILIGAPISALTLAGIFLVAWLAGFLVPFAPGGIGIREAALIALGTTVADPATLLSFAALTRLVTLAGDFLFGAAGYFLPSLLMRLNRQASAGQ